MNDDRAVELVRWGFHYARPRVKDMAEYRAAIRHVEANPDLWTRIGWTSE